MFELGNVDGRQRTASVAFEVHEIGSARRHVQAQRRSATHMAGGILGARGVPSIEAAPVSISHVHLSVAACMETFKLLRLSRRFHDHDDARRQGEVGAQAAAEPQAPLTVNLRAVRSSGSLQYREPPDHACRARGKVPNAEEEDPLA